MMTDDLTNMDRFNLLTAFIFNEMIESFPTRVAYSHEEMVRIAFPELDLDDPILSEQFVLVEHALTFLEREDFIYGSISNNVKGAQLTAKTLAVLDATPKGLSEPLKKRLTREVAQGARAAVVGETVGLFIRGAAGGLFGQVTD